MENNQERITLLGFIIWLLAALFFLYEFFLRTFVGSIAYQIIPDLHLNAETFSLLGTAYALSYGIMQIPVGFLCDKFGVRKIIVFAALICALATFLFAHSTGFVSAFLDRFFMGFGSSFAFVALLMVALTWFPRRYFGFFAGTSQFIGTMGPLLAAGPLVTMIKHSHESWRIALINVAMFGVILAILLFLVVKGRSNNVNESNASIKSVLLSERLKKLFGNKQVWLIGIYSGLVYTSIFLLAAVWGVDYLEVRGLSQITAAYIVSTAWIGYAIGCPFFGVLSDMLGRRKPFLVCCALLGALATIAITILSVTAVWIYGLLFFLLGLAASGQSIGFVVISEQVEDGIRAAALGFNNAAITVCDISLPAIVGGLITISAGGRAVNLVPHDFYLGFGIMPLLYITASLISLIWIREP